MNEKASEQIKIEEISAALNKAAESVFPFYDARLVLAVMIGQASALAATLRQLGVIPHTKIVEYFSAGMQGAFVDQQKLPKVRFANDDKGSTQ